MAGTSACGFGAGEGCDLRLCRNRKPKYRCNEHRPPRNLGHHPNPPLQKIVVRPTPRSEACVNLRMGSNCASGIVHETMEATPLLKPAGRAQT